MNEMQRQEILGKARVKILEELRRVWDGDVDDLIADIAEQALLEANPGRWAEIDQELEGGKDEGLDSFYGEVEEFVKGVKRYFASGVLGPICAYVSFDPIHGTHVELFSERPHTQSHGDPSDPENWGKWYRVYEGNIDGGDSIVVDSLGKDLFS